MNRIYALTGIFCLLVTGLAAYDSISSSIVCDGASWVSSSVISQGQTYAAHLFTTDIAALFRNLEVKDNGEVRTSTNARSEGPIGVDEYSAQTSGIAGEQNLCVFRLPENNTPSDSKIWYTGLMKSGQYVSTRDLIPGNDAVTMVNGSGIILVRAESRDLNRTITHDSDVIGNLNLTEGIRFGG